MQEQNIPLAPDERLDRVNEDILFIQKKEGLTFGTDAFLLASFVRSEPSSQGVDLGSGSGPVHHGFDLHSEYAEN